ncbi:hypothetical protein DFA_10972 [Cavenderia fasciculata]|uniref:Uncharacterized protein n=1 Tax=Cavenderia fasciculata TaxID=261658 RepID=F4QBX6_CACFS|nr:uncharacterized protein DFA_10972 [Cavenderia fasciculata]EGG14714.1 hypothetical protein DFA_10972 [Cavenderia fasciculata]|eukprot:XP_004351222.1 hypothetical protein DFA_10972 [Cavenderia fasciculata]
MDVDHVSYYEERIEEDEGVEEDVKNEVEVIDYRCSLFIVVIVMSGFSAEQKESLQKEFVALQSVMSATQQAKFDELHAVINRLVAQASAPSPVIAPAPVPGKRLKLGAPPPFNGDASSMRQWIAAVENQFNYYKTPNDERIPFARSFLTGPASSWFISVEASINSWDAFKSALKNRFSPVNAADVARAKLWKLSQDKLSIQEYTSTFDPATVATLAVPVPPVTCAQAGSRPISVTLLDHPIVHTTTSPSAHVTPYIPPPVSPVAPSIHVTPSISPPASPIAPSIVSPVSPPIVSTVIPPIVLSVTPPVTSPIIPSSPLAPPVPPPIHVVVQSVIPELSVSAIQRLFVDDDVDEFFIVKLYPSPSSNSGLAHVASVSSANPRFAKLLADYQDVLVDALPNYLADHRLHDMEIVEVDGAKPVYRRNNHLSSEENNVMFTTVEKGLASGRIAPSKSPYNSAVLFVRKKDGTLRMCVDFRALNKQTVADRFPLPRIDQLIEKIAKAKIFSKIDLKDGFNQIRIKDEHTHKTAFSTPSGHYEYTVIPFGLRNAPSAFVRAINAAFADILDTFVIIYIDDILIFSENENDHYEHIKQVLDRLRSNKLFANKAKSSFLVKEVEFLGHLITPGYIRPLADKLAAVKDWPTPSTVTELQSFLGLCNYYRNFIDHFADHAAPLYDATTKKTLSWSDSLSAAFGKIKSLLCECTSLFIPDMDGPFTVTTDASDFGIGAVLEQDGRPVAFESRKMTKAERDAVGTDDKVGRWARFIGEFRYTFKHKPGKLNVVADALSRRPDYKEAISSPIVDPHFNDRIKKGYKSDLFYSDIINGKSRLHFHVSTNKLVYFTDLPPARGTGHNALLTIVDKFSKFVVYIPTFVNATAEDTAVLFYDQFYLRYGLPLNIVSDRDAKFTSNFWEALFKLLGSKLSFSSSFHPQTDGQSERMNRVTNEMMRSHVNYKMDNWVELLPTLAFTYNTTIHSSSNHSPAHLIHGFELINPLRLLSSSDIDSDTPAVNDFIDNRIMSWRHATQCLAEAQSSQKEYHDRGKVQESLNVGDMVLLNRKNITLAADSRRHSWKWYNKWIGPFKIISVITNHNDEKSAYKLELPDTMAIHPVFHSSLLKPFHHSSRFSDTTYQVSIPTSGLIEEHLIEAIVDFRLHYNKPQYLVKWTGLDNYNNRWSTRDQIPTHILDEFEQLNPEHAMHNSTNKKSPTDDSTTDILSNDTTLNLNSTPNGHVDSSDSNVTVNLVPSVFNTTQSPVITEAPDATPNPVLSKPLPPSILLRRILQKPVSPSATAKPPSPAPSITAKAHSPSLANTPASGKDFKKSRRAWWIILVSPIRVASYNCISIV